MSSARIPVLLGGLLAALALAAPASAATAGVTAGVLGFDAAPGEFNELTITQTAGRLEIRDPGASALTPGPGCVADAGRLLCAPAGVVRVEVRAGDRADLIRLALGLDSVVAGGAGDDQVIGSVGDDRLLGEAGADYIEGGIGNDALLGGTGRDLLSGGQGGDDLNGGESSDELNGDEGDDALAGGDGNERMSGGPGADRLAGEAGNDSINPGAGLDQVDAGDGRDVVDAGDGEVDAVACGPGSDGARADSGDAVGLDCERLRDPSGAIVRSGRTPAPTPSPDPPPPDPTTLQPLVPSPIVRVTGVVRGSRTQFQNVSVRAPSGSRVESRCRGRGCPYRRRVTTIAAGRGSIQLRRLHGRYGSGVIFEVFVTQADRLGKYTRLRTRRGKPPLRQDGCVASDVAKRVRCPF